MNNKIEPGAVTELDYQQNNIEQIFYKHKDRITNAADSLVEATCVMYEAIEGRINLLIEKTEYPCRYVMLMGGILINGDHDMGSFNSCKRFHVVDLSDGNKYDMKSILLSGR